MWLVRAPVADTSQSEYASIRFSPDLDAALNIYSPETFCLLVSVIVAYVIVKLNWQKNLLTD